MIFDFCRTEVACPEFVMLGLLGSDCFAEIVCADFCGTEFVMLSWSSRTEV